jgi:chemotaxis signal transduction protein
MFTIDAETAAKAVTECVGLLGQAFSDSATLRLREILRISSTIPVPHAPECVRGVVWLRGRTIPVLDRKWRSGATQHTSAENSCIVIVQAQVGENQPILLGLVAETDDQPHLHGAEDFSGRFESRPLTDSPHLTGVSVLTQRLRSLMAHG